MEEIKFLYEDFTWEEVREVVRENRVVLQPVGSIEQHGPHLALKTDIMIARAFCVEAGRRTPSEVIVMPSIPYGFNAHHMDFPGTISVDGETFINFVLCVMKSLVTHGFRKILLVNGHGSNNPFLDIVARRTIIETEALCGTCMPYSLIRECIAEKSECQWNSHACEIETSLLMYLSPQDVRVEKITKEIGFPISKYHWRSLTKASPLNMMDIWSRISETGIAGDPTLASKEKGKEIFEAGVENLIELVKEFRAREIAPRKDHHRKDM